MPEAPTKLDEGTAEKTAPMPVSVMEVASTRRVVDAWPELCGVKIALKVTDAFGAS